jgi:hypothetical protein
MLWEAITGCSAHKGKSVDQLLLGLWSGTLRLDTEGIEEDRGFGCCGRLRQLVERCLSMLPEDRPCMIEVASCLEGIVSYVNDKEQR